MEMQVRNVNEAFQFCVMGTPPMRQRCSRNGNMWEYEGIWTTSYTRPLERVLWNPSRNANPFFHLFEAMWILAGRNDVEFLTHFVKKMADYSDDGKTFHAAYGYRIMEHLPFVIRQLRADPDTRRAVVNIWDNALDHTQSKDLPCNDLLVFRMYNGKLNLTVFNRSNDLVWGAYGANAVQFAFILEYVAEQVGVEVGTYNQVSSCMHVYDIHWPLDYQIVPDYYRQGITPHPLGSDEPGWHEDLQGFFMKWDVPDFPCKFQTKWWNTVMWPMWMAFNGFKAGSNTADWLEVNCSATDWSIAGAAWIRRRISANSAG